MKRHNSARRSFPGVFFCVLLEMVGTTAWAKPQNQPHKPPYTLAAYEALAAENAEKDLQAKIKLLDGFTANYPDSSLIPFVYTDYYQIYFSLQKYPDAVAYTDKLLALGDKVIPDPSGFQSPEEFAREVVREHLRALTLRAMAYAVGCADIALQTPEASAKAKDAAAEGLRLLNQLSKNTDVIDEEIVSRRASYEMTFASTVRIADSYLKGDPVDCVPLPPPSQPPVPPNVRFDRFIQDMLNEERRTSVQ
jgi:hypothetical protein